MPDRGSSFGGERELNGFSQVERSPVRSGDGQFGVVARMEIWEKRSMKTRPYGGIGMPVSTAQSTKRVSSRLRSVATLTVRRE